MAEVETINKLITIHFNSIGWLLVIILSLFIFFIILSIVKKQWRWFFVNLALLVLTWSLTVTEKITTHTELVNETIYIINERIIYINDISFIILKAMYLMITLQLIILFLMWIYNLIVTGKDFILNPDKANKEDFVKEFFKLKKP